MQGLRQVSSLQNDTIKLIRSLEMRKARRETGLFLAEGAGVLDVARAQGWVPKILLVGRGAIEVAHTRALVEWALAKGAECLDVPDQLLAKVSERDNPQTLVCALEQRWTEAPEPSREPAETWLALESARYPRNVGTIMRTAAAVGVRVIVLVGESCDPFAIEAVRASVGAIFRVPLARMSQDDFLALMRRWPGESIGTHVATDTDYRRAYQGPALVVMGTEQSGLSAPVAQACSRLVKIPMVGGVDSLNLATAAALVLYETRRPYIAI